MFIDRLLPWFVFVGSAIMEVGGDALVRKGLKGSGVFFIALGFVVLGCYGLLVNMVKWDFSKLLGVYVAVFALVSVLFAKLVFKESISNATWLGVAVILVGGLIIQFGDGLLQ